MKISFERLRQVLKEELEKYDGDPVLLTYDTEFLDNLLFEEGSRNSKKFSEKLQPVLIKINYSNVNFDKFDARDFDFSPYTGIRINPQTIYYKQLGAAKCKGVEFIGSFDEVLVVNTDFTGSRGAKINPQIIQSKDLSGAICADVEFIDAYGLKPDFTGVDIVGTDFNGSNYDEAIKEEYEFREKVKLAIYGNNKIEY